MSKISDIELHVITRICHRTVFPHRTKNDSEPYRTKIDTVACLYTWATVPILVRYGSRWFRTKTKNENESSVRIAVKRQKHWFGTLHASNRTTIKRYGSLKPLRYEHGDKFGANTVKVVKS